MKRYFLAMLLLLGAASLASADYVLLMINLSSSGSSTKPPGGGMVGVPPGGVRGFPAGGGAVGMGGVPPGGVAGQRGFPAGGGAAGMAGFPMGGGAVGMGGVPPGGAAGAVGFPAGGGAAGMAGFPPVGMAGMRGGPTPPPRPSGTPDNDENVQTVAVVVEVNPNNFGFGDPWKKFEQKKPITVAHPWGGTAILRSECPIGKVVPLTDNDGKSIPSLQRKYDAEFKRVVSVENPDAEEVQRLASWCLAHGMVKQFTEVMDKLVELNKKLPVCVTYAEIREALKRAPEAPKVPDWVATLLPNNRSTEKPGYHYAIYHSIESKDAAKTALEAMEKSFQGFYYWWAFHGKVLPVPKQIQVVLIPEKGTEFKKFHTIMTPTPVVADAFFARRESVLVMAPQRLDDRYDAMEKFAGRWYDNGVSRQLVLSGKKPPTSQVPAEDLPDAQMASLVLKAMETERELTAATHDGSRQLLYASGLLPRSLVAPEWVLFGIGSFFETSPESPWPGIGAPSYYWLPQFKEHKEAWFERKPEDTLRRVVTDSYFRNLPSRGDAGTRERLHYDAALRHARSASWGLTYFLANRKLDGLQRYFKELSKLPRDMELDDSVLLMAFAKAFGAADAKNHIDDAKLTALAAEWYKYLDNTELESKELERQIRLFYRDSQLKSTEKKPETKP
jgi:hypothetical protein